MADRDDSNADSQPRPDQTLNQTSNKELTGKVGSRRARARLRAPDYPAGLHQDGLSPDGRTAGLSRIAYAKALATPSADGIRAGLVFQAHW